MAPTAIALHKLCGETRNAAFRDAAERGFAYQRGDAKRWIATRPAMIPSMV